MQNLIVGNKCFFFNVKIYLIGSGKVSLIAEEDKKIKTIELKDVQLYPLITEKNKLLKKDKIDIDYVEDFKFFENLDELIKFLNEFLLKKAELVNAFLKKISLKTKKENLYYFFDFYYLKFGYGKLYKKTTIKVENSEEFIDYSIILKNVSFIEIDNFDNKNKIYKIDKINIKNVFFTSNLEEVKKFLYVYFSFVLNANVQNFKNLLK